MRGARGRSEGRVDLARAELTALERDEHIAERVRLVEKKGAGTVACADRAGNDTRKDGRKKGPQHQPSGISAASRALGIDRNDAHRAVKVAGLSPEAKKAAEIAENLIRKELTAEERAAHTLLYAAELKASGTCATVSEKNAKGGKKGCATRWDKSPSADGHLDDKPTVTQAAAAGLGITPNAVQLRVKAAARAAGSEPVSIERDSPERLREVGQAALDKAL